MTYLYPIAIKPFVSLIVAKTDSGYFIHSLMKKNGDIATLEESADWAGPGLDVDKITHWGPIA